jgi:hypothetical protein
MNNFCKYDSGKENPLELLKSQINVEAASVVVVRPSTVIKRR